MGNVYVSTYCKYNGGSLQGGWINVDDYETKSEFLRACRELHEDEEDPELIFQDWEDIPEGLISEGWISDIVFKTSEIRARVSAFGAEYSDFDEFCDYYGYTNQMEAIDAFEDAFIFRGTLREFVEMCEDVPDRLYNYIRWEDLEQLYDLDGYHEIGGCVFRNC